MTLVAFIAVGRFGLGGRVEDAAVATGDARDWLKAQLAVAGSVPAAFTGLPAGNELVGRLVRAREAAREARHGAASFPGGPSAAGSGGPGAGAPQHGPGPGTGMAALVPSLLSALGDADGGDERPLVRPSKTIALPPLATGPARGLAPGSQAGAGLAGLQDPFRLFQREMRDLYLREAGARIQAMANTDQPFRERLVAFWGNHFTVSIQRPVVAGLVGSFEREAIRPHVTGRFEDMLRAAARHPAMLLYLDNADSIGPNSRAGQRSRRGLNENLAREVLELHTLGVEGGYSQDDVRAFAAILTGWSIPGPRDADTVTDGFVFRPAAHEPGDKSLLGSRYPEAGEAEGVAALAALARHPATARRLATKLARHFIADQPPAAAVARLERVFRDSGGDLGQVARALVDSPEAWAEPLAKIKTPQELVVSTLRATGTGSPPERVVGQLRQLGQMPFAAPSPAGWPDDAGHWIGPESMMQRIEWCALAGHWLAPMVRPANLLETALGPVARPETRQAVLQAPSVAEAVALLLASPEFQRR